jgi:biotin carboxyl carrier protein
MEEAVKLTAKVDDRELALTLVDSGDLLTVAIDGRQYEIRVQTSAGDDYLLFHNSHVYDCRVDSLPPSRESFDVILKNKRHRVTVIDPRRLRADENSDRHQHGPTEIAAQMPGKVVRVLVEAGAHVEKGAGIIVVEAMKMQNEMKSPRDGVVVSINVGPGDTVNAGEVLATVGDVE